jgi:hypothetical protein
LDEPVEIKVNNRLVFKGNITTRSDGISTGGLKLSYGCHSTILDMTHVTLTEAPSVARIAQFNLIVPGSDGIRRTYNVANANQILQTFGVGGGPSVYAGYINVVDQTRLAAAELVLSKIGNYKLYHDMSTGLNYAYRFGSHGFSTRQFFIGKNITDYNIRKSNMGIVNSVEIMGYPTLVTTRHKVNLLYGTDPDGKMSAYFIVSGGNIQGIQAFGHSKPKPDIQYDESIQVSILSFEDKFSADMREIKRKEDLAALDPWGFAQTYPVRKKVEPTDPKYALRPAIADLKEYDAEWVTLSGNVVYRGNGEARVYLAEVPKQWHANVRTGKVKRSAIAHNVYPKGIVGDPDKTETVKVLLDYDYAIGSVEVQYTYEAGNLYVRVGSGLPSKSITDPQYQAIEDSVNHVSTSGRVYAEMLSRAYSTLAQLSQDAIGGSITIIGDETMDLRSSVNVGGSILEVSGIDHNFVNGFLTTIALTNEPFVVTPVFAPIYISPAKPNEKNNKLWTTTYDLTNLINLVKDLQKQKEAAANAEKLAPKSSPFTTFQ